MVSTRQVLRGAPPDTPPRSLAGAPIPRRRSAHENRILAIDRITGLGPESQPTSNAHGSEPSRDRVTILHPDAQMYLECPPPSLPGADRDSGVAKVGSGGTKGW
jgi:hypothetical protein